MENYILEAVEQQQLPKEFAETVDRWFRPIAADVATRRKHHGGTFLLGVQGTQGSGKSTLASFMCLLLEKEFNLSACSLSIDDFYLTLNERQRLAETVHPLFITRGVPGTHDIDLAMRTIHQLRSASSIDLCAIPRFDKALDDRFKKTEWTYVNGPIDVIVLEGWCVGVPPQPEECLLTAVNQLEAEEDEDGVWRKYVNDALRNDYDQLFGQIDGLVVLNAPSFDCVFQWRLLQEQKLASRWAKQRANQQNKILSPEQIKRFISHYQRLTEHGLVELPTLCDWQLQLAPDHTITGITKNTG